MKIVGAVGVDAFVEDEMLPLFFRCQCLAAMRTPQGNLPGEAVFIWGNVCIAYLAFQLSGLAVIAVKIRLRGAAGRAGAVLRDVTFFTAGDGFYFNMVPVFKVRDEETPVPLLMDNLDVWKLVHFQFLITWGMGILKSPLLEGDISADNVNQPAVLLIKILNYGK